MLQQLHVRNYTIIDEVRIDFADGLNIITGETGAGKSILLGALGLVLGDRADMSTLFDKSKKCIVEATFSAQKKDLRPFFESHELDYDDIIIIRRELLPSERSRAFINDTPVKLGVLQALTQQLINVHRQFATLDIFQPEFQIRMLDTLAGQQREAEDYVKTFKTFRKDELHLKALKEEIAQASREQDFIRFQVNEIQDFELNLETDDQLQYILQQAEHEEDIAQVLSEINNMMSSGDQNLSDQLQHAIQRVRQVARFNGKFEELANRLEAIHIELEDISSNLDAYGPDDSLSPEELEDIQKRHDQLQRLFFKHQVSEVSELAELLKSLENQLADDDAKQQEADDLEKQLESQRNTLKESATKLSNNRKRVVTDFTKRIESQLSDLAMENARFNVEIKPIDLSLHGIDQVRFLFSANPGSELQNLQQVASGGELSRLSLALKSIVAHEMELPSMVFDEIDSGVSGDTALRMGRLLKSLGSDFQTIVITHSPQVAAQGQAHFFVEKKVSGQQTQTSIRLLNEKARIEKIAGMLSGDPPTPAAIKNAKELIKLQSEIQPTV